jgi:hypothetical protein
LNGQVSVLVVMGCVDGWKNEWKHVCWDAGDMISMLCVRAGWSMHYERDMREGKLETPIVDDMDDGRQAGRRTARQITRQAGSLWPDL